MTIPRWSPPIEPSKLEARILKRLGRTKKLFAFLREHRHELFDDSFQDELAAMYRDTGGKEPVAPAKLAMGLLLQSYVKASDAEAVELTVMDMRWRMVLGHFDEEPAFSQGALHDFRHRFIKHDMDRRLLERTVELARRTKGFDAKKLPGTLRVAIDSSPLEGAGRVEDTINLLGHAARRLVMCVATLLEMEFEDVCEQAGIPALLEPSIKKALDCDWAEPGARDEAVNDLMDQINSLQMWLAKRQATLAQPVVQAAVSTLQDIIKQDLEPDPTPPTGKKRRGLRIRKGVATDRRISITDPDMRHGRKTKSKRFNGFKRHIAADLDLGVILACAVAPANRPEEEAAEPLSADITRQGVRVHELYIDRGYVNAPLVKEVLERRGDVVCRPWRTQNSRGLYSKKNFRLDVYRGSITCPAGQTLEYTPGIAEVVEFDADVCDVCPVRSRCTEAEFGTGRTVSIGENEKLQEQLRKRAASPWGRQLLRRRVAVEHHLAHLAARQGRRARYMGIRKNVFDVRRAASLQNLETTHRWLLAEAA
jgi:hypothetical protein